VRGRSRLSLRPSPSPGAGKATPVKVDVWNLSGISALRDHRSLLALSGLFSLSKDKAALRPNFSHSDTPREFPKAERPFGSRVETAPSGRYEDTFHHMAVLQRATWTSSKFIAAYTVPVSAWPGAAGIPRMTLAVRSRSARGSSGSWSQKSSADTSAISAPMSLLL